VTQRVQNDQPPDLQHMTGCRTPLVPTLSDMADSPRVFLDVGAHHGETLRVAMESEWGFDRIWCFEPVNSCVEVLRSVADDRVEVVPSGLWSTDAMMDIHDPGALHASVDSEASRRGEIESCTFLDAARWFAEHISLNDKVWLKINIESAEIEVLDRLVASGEIHKVNHLVVHFDAEKFVGRKSDADRTRALLSSTGVNWRDAADVMFGRTVEAKTRAWLATTHGRRWAFLRAKAEHKLRAQAWRWRKQIRRS